MESIGEWILDVGSSCLSLLDTSSPPASSFANLFLFQNETLGLDYIEEQFPNQI